MTPCLAISFLNLSHLFRCKTSLGAMDISKQTQGTTDAHGIERKAPMVLTDPTDDLPKFKDLPLDPSHPPHSAWFLWGKDDQLGCLNHLTPERVVAAAKEIQTGTSVGLNWEMHQMSSPPPYRSTLKHEIFSIGGQFLVTSIAVCLRVGAKP